MNQDCRVAISQRLCPPWRVPFFRALAQRPGIDLSVFYGRGTPDGAAQNDPAPSGFRAVQLPTISRRYVENGAEKYRAVHPTLLCELFRGRFDVVIVEPFTNFGNDVLARMYTLVTGAAFIWSDVGEPPEPSPLRRALHPILRRFIRTSTACIGLNQVAVGDFLAAGIPHNRVFLAPNAIDSGSIGREAADLEPARHSVRNSLGIGENDFAALFVGAIERRKRLDLFVNAVGLLRESGVPVTGVIVGDGSHLAELRGSIPAAARGHVLFEGSHYDDVARYFVACDAVVLPGQGGLTLNQALACGVPCITTQDAVGGGDTVRDYVSHGHNGLLVEPGSLSALEGAIRQLATDNRLRDTIRTGARGSRTSHSLEAMVDGYAAAIAYAMGHKRCASV